MVTEVSDVAKAHAAREKRRKKAREKLFARKIADRAEFLAKRAEQWRAEHLRKAYSRVRRRAGVGVGEGGEGGCVRGDHSVASQQDMGLSPLS